jgi:cell wall-associated NlpC family hydrolase
MRGKTLFICSALFLLFNLLAGCSFKGEKIDENLSGRYGTAKNSEVPGNAVQEIINSKNAGVISDIVVDVFSKASTQSERLTQAIFNQPVEILEEKDLWVKVKVIDGCTGWVKSKYVDRGCTSLKVGGIKYRVVVTTKKLKVLSSAKNGTVLTEAVMGTEFYPVNSVDGWYEVALPENKKGWISESGTIRIPVDKNISRTNADDFVATAMKFNGTVYLSGGISGWSGIDSSGLTYICSRINGVDIPRKVDQQYKLGKEIEKNIKLLIPGDMVFFSSNEELKDISFVGIYTGDGKFLHASMSKGSVVLSSIEDNFFHKRLIGIRRIF